MRRFMFVVLVVAGCGDDGHRVIPDGPFIDDAPNDTGGGTPVTVTIAHNGMPAAGTYVYFQNADSTLVSATTTDATGTASAVMAAGGFVTTVEQPVALNVGGVSDTLHTWAGVKPGDHLLLTDGATVTALPMTVTIPTDAGHTVTDYQVTSNCGSGTLTPPVGSAPPPTLQATVNFFCATADVLVVARGPSQVPLSSFFVGGAAISNGGALDMHAATYTDAVNRSYTYTNYPDPATNITVVDIYFTSRGEIYERQHTHVGDVATSMNAMPAPFTGANQAVVTQQSVLGSFTEHHFLDWRAAPGDYTADYASKLVEDYSSFTSLGTDHEITWTQTPNALTADFMMARFSSNRTPRTWVWEVMSPGSPNIQLPTVPTDLFDYNWQTNDPYTLFSLDSFKMPGGYDAVRAKMFSLGGPQDLFTGPSGTISGNSWQNPP